MRSVLMVPTALLILVASGCAKQPATMPASASAPSPGSSTGSSGAGRMQPATAQSTTGAGGAGRATAGRTDSAMGASRPAPRDFMENAALKDINFDFDKYDVRPDDAKILDGNASWLKSNANNLVLIEGHCDERGTNEYNLALGERRAKAAMNYLVSQGVQASRITIISYGEERPVCTEKTEACWAKNRRASFLVKPR